MRLDWTELVTVYWYQMQSRDLPEVCSRSERRMVWVEVVLRYGESCGLSLSPSLSLSPFSLHNDGFETHTFAEETTPLPEKHHTACVNFHISREISTVVTIPLTGTVQNTLFWWGPTKKPQDSQSITTQYKCTQIYDILHSRQILYKLSYLGSMYLLPLRTSWTP